MTSNIACFVLIAICLAAMLGYLALVYYDASAKMLVCFSRVAQGAIMVALGAAIWFALAAQ